MKKSVLLLTILTITLVLSSCYRENYSPNNYFVSSATFYETDKHFYIKTDAGDKLWPSASNISPNKHKDGDRIIVEFTVLKDAPRDSVDYDYYVKVNSTKDILTKNIFRFNENTSKEVKDSIGNDFVSIEDFWITDDYLNVQFTFGGGSRVHYITLVQDSTDLTSSRGDLILELKHNRNNDLYNYRQWGIASFNLKDLQEIGKDSISLVLRTQRNDDEHHYQKAINYNYGNDSVDTKHVFTRTIEDLMIE